jgi:probable addiction module antidote protein
VKTVPFDPAEHLTSARAQRELIVDALETGDAGYVAAALGTVARARGMSKIAEEAGVTRASLYKALSPSGDPQLTTLLGVLKAMGLSLTVKTKRKAAA